MEARKRPYCRLPLSVVVALVRVAVVLELAELAMVDIPRSAIGISIMSVIFLEWMAMPNLMVAHPSTTDAEIL